MRRFVLALCLGACTHSAVTIGVGERGALQLRRLDNGVTYPYYRPDPARACTAAAAEPRQRIVDAAVREWARFGYPIGRGLDAAALRPSFPALARINTKVAPYTEDDLPTLAAIGDYWAVLADADSGAVEDVGAFEIARQNRIWRENARAPRYNRGWETPWSAAFVSSVMCDAGIAGFRLSWAHRDYVDAAIAASDGGAAHPYHARDADAAPAVGDLICSGRAGYRPRDVAARREESDMEGEMHCDIVVAVNDAQGLILAIGGNVENAVTALPYRFVRTGDGARIRAVCSGEKVCAEDAVFALLQLQAPQSAANLAHARPLGAAPAGSQ